MNAYELVTQHGAVFAVIPADVLPTYLEMTQASKWQKLGPCFVSVATGDSLIPVLEA
jgi:hypothetical protein